MAVKIVHSIFMVHKKIGDCTMNFINAIFMAMKTKITSFSWPFHGFLTKVGFIVGVYAFRTILCSAVVYLSTVIQNEVLFLGAVHFKVVHGLGVSVLSITYSQMTKNCLLTD